MTLCTFGPPSDRKRRWLLKFEDADKGDMHFDNEPEAMAMFDRCKDAWTCTLFVTAEFREQPRRDPGDWDHRTAGKASFFNPIR